MASGINGQTKSSATTASRVSRANQIWRVERMPLIVPCADCLALQRESQPSGPGRTDDPCHLVWQVSEIRKLEHGDNRTDPCHLAWQVRKILTGEFKNNAIRRAERAESHFPTYVGTRRAGRGLALNGDEF